MSCKRVLSSSGIAAVASAGCCDESPSPTKRKTKPKFDTKLRKRHFLRGAKDVEEVPLSNSDNNEKDNTVATNVAVEAATNVAVSSDQEAGQEQKETFFQQFVLYCGILVFVVGGCVISYWCRVANRTTKDEEKALAIFFSARFRVGIVLLCSGLIAISGSALADKFTEPFRWIRPYCYISYIIFFLLMIIAGIYACDVYFWGSGLYHGLLWIMSSCTGDITPCTKELDDNFLLIEEKDHYISYANRKRVDDNCWSKPTLIQWDKTKYQPNRAVAEACLKNWAVYEWIPNRMRSGTSDICRESLRTKQDVIYIADDWLANPKYTNVHQFLEDGKEMPFNGCVRELDDVFVGKQEEYVKYANFDYLEERFEREKQSLKNNYPTLTEEALDNKITRPTKYPNEFCWETRQNQLISAYGLWPRDDCLRSWALREIPKITSCVEFWEVCREEGNPDEQNFEENVIGNWLANRGDCCHMVVNARERGINLKNWLEDNPVPPKEYYGDTEGAQLEWR